MEKNNGQRSAERATHINDSLRLVTSATQRIFIQRRLNPTLGRIPEGVTLFGHGDETMKSVRSSHGTILEFWQFNGESETKYVVVAEGPLRGGVTAVRVHVEDFNSGFEPYGTRDYPYDETNPGDTLPFSRVMSVLAEAHRLSGLAHTPPVEV